MNTLEINNQVRWFKKGDSANIKWSHDSREHDFTGDVTERSFTLVLLTGRTTLDDGGAFNASVSLTWDRQEETYKVRYMGQTDGNDIEHVEVTMYQKVRGFLGA